MLRKKLVTKSSEGGSHLDVRYRAGLTREDLVASVVANTLRGLINAHGRAAVHGFVDAVSSDREALDELRRLLGPKKRKKD